MYTHWTFLRSDSQDNPVKIKLGIQTRHSNPSLSSSFPSSPIGWDGPTVVDYGKMPQTTHFSFRSFSFFFLSFFSFLDELGDEINCIQTGAHHFFLGFSISNLPHLSPSKLLIKPWSSTDCWLKLALVVCPYLEYSTSPSLLSQLILVDWCRKKTTYELKSSEE